MKLDLKENSHSFLKEAAQNAVDGTEDPSRWPFAILHIVQSLELTLKLMLQSHHPALIYDKIDAPDRTVSLRNAMRRLSDQKLEMGELTQLECARIEKAAKIRHEITHFECDFSPELGAAKFAEMFGLVTYLQERHLDLSVTDVLETEVFAALVSQAKNYEELKNRAYQKISDDRIEEDLLLSCQDCWELTFVLSDGINECYICRNTAEVSDCEYCGKTNYIEHLKDLYELIDADNDHGQLIVINNFGFDPSKNCCSKCRTEINEEIENQRSVDYHYERMIDHEAASSNFSDASDVY